MKLGEAEMGDRRFRTLRASGAVELLERAVDMVANPLFPRHLHVPRLGVVLYSVPNVPDSLWTRNHMDQGRGCATSPSWCK